MVAHDATVPRLLLCSEMIEDDGADDDGAGVLTRLRLFDSAVKPSGTQNGWPGARRRHHLQTRTRAEARLAAVTIAEDTKLRSIPALRARLKKLSEFVLRADAFAPFVMITASWPPSVAVPVSVTLPRSAAVGTGPGKTLATFGGRSSSSRCCSRKIHPPMDT